MQGQAQSSLVMKKFLTIVAGIIVGSFPVAIAAVFALFISLSFPGIVGVSVSVLLVLAAIWTGVAIFRNIQKVGLIEFFTRVHATPDLDNLEPANDESTTKRKRRS